MGSGAQRRAIRVIAPPTAGGVESVEFIYISNLACPGCYDPVDDGNEGFVHMADGSPLCMGETESVERCDSDD